MLTKLNEQLANDGMVLLRNFYDVQTEVMPIQRGAKYIIEQLLAENNNDLPDCNWSSASSAGISKLASTDRTLAGHVYDAVKHVPALGQLVYSQKNFDLFAALRPNLVPGLAYDGYGIRIDFPNEEKFRAFWHQEFPTQQRSVDGLVFWTPLVSIEEDMGPVQVAKGSHKEGPIETFFDEGGASRSGAYARRLKNEEEILKKYEIVAPLLEPGDLLVMDYLTLHQSGFNISNKPRWSLQFRLFNYNDETGKQIHWSRNIVEESDLISKAKHNQSGNN